MEVYLIGNGFDLDLGIDSSYISYYRSRYFIDLCMRSPVARYIKSLNEKDYKENWVDFEEAIKLYCINILGNEFAVEKERLKKEQNLKEFEDHFKEICNSIAQFLSEQASKVDLSTIPDTKNSILIAKEIVDRFERTSNLSGGLISENNNIKIITFNYTDSLTKLIEKEARRNGLYQMALEKSLQIIFRKLKIVLFTYMAH